MPSHAKTFHVIKNYDDLTKIVGCGVNMNARWGALIPAGSLGVKEQSFEIIYYPDASFRFRNAYGVYIGVNNVTSGEKLTADAGLNNYSKWKLIVNPGGGFFIKTTSGAEDLYWKLSSTGDSIELSTTSQLWDVQEALGVPPTILLAID